MIAIHFFLESFNNFIDQWLIPFDAYLDTIFMYIIQNLPEKFKSIAHEYLLSMNPHDSMINARALRLIDDILNKDTQSEAFIDNLRSNFYWIKLEKIHKILVDDTQFEEFRKNISKDLSDGMMPEKALSHALEKIIAIDIMIAKNEIDELPTDLKEYAYSLTNNLNEGNNKWSFSLEWWITYIDALKETNAKNIVENLSEEHKHIVEELSNSDIKFDYRGILKEVAAKQAIDKLPDDLKKHANGAINDFQTKYPQRPWEAYTYALYETEKFDEYRNLDPKYKEYADSLIKDPTNYYSYKWVIDRVNDKKIIDNLSPKLKQFVDKELKNWNWMSWSKLSERAIQQQNAMDKITQLDEPYLSYAKDHLNHPENAYEPSEALAYGNYEKEVQDKINKEEELYRNYASEYLKHYPNDRPSIIFEEIWIYKRVLESNQYSDAYKQHFIEEVKTLISADSAFRSTRSYMKQQELE